MTGIELKQARIKAGLTQEKLAVIINHSSSTLRRWENGNMNIPKIKIPGIRQAIETYERTGQIAA